MKNANCESTQIFVDLFTMHRKFAQTGVAAGVLSFSEIKRFPLRGSENLRFFVLFDPEFFETG